MGLDSTTLQRQVTPDEIAKNYDQIAQRWRSDVFPEKNGIAQHERAIAFLAQPGRALDVGCGGSGRIIAFLEERGFQVEGVDLSEEMLKLARARHPAATFHHADIVTWQLPGEFDFISAWDSVWHVPLADQEGVLTKMLAGLVPGGVCLFSIGGVDEPGELVNSAMGVPMYHASLGVAQTLRVIDRAGCVCRHLEYDRHPELHVAVVAQRL